MPKKSPKDRTNTLRDVADGVTAALHKSEIDIVSPTQLEQLVAESPTEQTVTLPVGALKVWRRRIRDELLEELDAAGRLLPEGELRVARSA